MAKISLIAKFTSAEGRRDELVAILTKMLPQVETEDGTELYIVNEEVGDPNVVWCFELYADGEALAAHSSSAAMLEAMTALGGDVTGAPVELMLLNPIEAKGVDL